MNIEFKGNEQLGDHYVKISKAANDLIGMLHEFPMQNLHNTEEIMNLSVQDIRDWSCLQLGKLHTFVGSSSPRWKTHEELNEQMDEIERKVGNGDA